MDTDIRITDIFTYVNDLDMWHFFFQEKKDGEDILTVYANQGWWNYQAIITFNHVLFSNCPPLLDFNILCRLATEEEESDLRSLYDFSEAYHVYCFEDTSKYYTLGPIKRDKSGRIDPQFLETVRNNRSLRQQRKTFIIAQSVRVVAFFSDRHFGNELDLWQKADIADLSEDCRKIFQGAVETSIRWAKSVEDKKRANQPNPDIDKQA